MKEALKKSLLLVLRILISLGLIGWILYKVDRRELAETLKSINLWWLLLSFAAYFVVNLFCTWRWQVLL
jgi:uncharacterized membrane protein YbhN (UPF0104 family)